MPVLTEARWDCSYSAITKQIRPNGADLWGLLPCGIDQAADELGLWGKKVASPRWSRYRGLSRPFLPLRSFHMRRLLSLSILSLLFVAPVFSADEEAVNLLPHGDFKQHWE